MYAFIQPNPLAHLDLIDYACQDLMISFAVVSKEAGLSNFSPITNMTVAIRGNQLLTKNTGIVSTYKDCYETFSLTYNLWQMFMLSI